jgi:hypothetical protein
VKLGDETQIVTCVGVDSVSFGPECNADFVHFVWEFNNISAFGGIPWFSYPSPEPDAEITLIVIAGCCVYVITGRNVTAGRSPLGVLAVLPHFRMASAIS